MNKYLALLEQAKASVEAANKLLDEAGGQDLPAEKGAEFDRLMAEADGLQKQAERIKLIEARDAELKALKAAAPQPADGEKPVTDDVAFKTVYALRYGDEPEFKQRVMKDLIGHNYRQMIDDQNAAFAKYLRFGDRMLEREEIKLLKQQVFPWAQIEGLIRSGMGINEIKTTMVEAQGSLGGYAVPPNVQAEIAGRLPGLTVVRGNGARVIELTSGTGVDVPIYTGGDARYRGALRGLWGTETQSPTEDNATLGYTTVIAHIYTYKVAMSQSLVEDASNLVYLVQSDITSTAAIDEDEAFLIGDGVGKPLGVLPASGNSLSLTEVNSGNASVLTADGLIGLSDALDVQYDMNAVYVFAKATGTAIRKLKTGDGQYLFDRDLENNKRTLLGSVFARSEAMPAIAANAYPIVRGDFSGYWIVQKAGLTIVRFQDSNTGINKVEYHVRRRVGGRVVEPWKFSTQKVAA